MEIVVISGKGGTGKSSFVAAMATINKDVVLVDCDVDAINLYLLFNPKCEESEVYVGAEKAVINSSKCIGCGICFSNCNFNAIQADGNKYMVKHISCEGCKLCFRLCPEKAVSIVQNNKSRIYSGVFRNGKMVYGYLAPGEENSGKLVGIVREKAKKISKNNNNALIIIDGPPGIGCPVISSVTGTDIIVVVTESSKSGLFDLERALEMIKQFNGKVWVVINKYDLNIDLSLQIEAFCLKNNIPVAGKIPFDMQIVDALINCKSICEYAPDSKTSKIIRGINNSILKNINIMC